MISSIPQPHKSDLKFLQRWLERPNMGNCSLVGADRHVYNTNTSGLGSLASKHGNIDPLTSLLLYSLPSLYHRLIVGPLYRLLGTWVKVLHCQLLQFYCMTDLCRSQKAMCQTIDPGPLTRAATNQDPRLRDVPLPLCRPPRTQENTLVQVNTRLNKSPSISRIMSSSIATRIFTFLPAL
jgi:hypothetical protein